MIHRLEDMITARPGEFLSAVKWKLRDNDHATPKQKLTHLTLLCEICRQQVETSVGGAEGVARRFDMHEGCKPKEEWPERPGPTPRTNPTEKAAERERIRRELEGH